METQFFADTLNGRPGCTQAIQNQNPSAVIAPGSFYGAHYQDPSNTNSAVLPGIFTNMNTGLDNQVPVQCFDSTAADLLDQFVPHANRADGTFQGVPLGHERGNQFTVK